MDKLLKYKKLILVGVIFLSITSLALLYLLNRKKNLDQNQQFSIRTFIKQPLENISNILPGQRSPTPEPGYKKQLKETKSAQERRLILETSIITNNALALPRDLSTKAQDILNRADNQKSTPPAKEATNTPEDNVGKENTLISSNSMEVSFFLDEILIKNNPESAIKTDPILQPLKPEELDILQSIGVIKTSDINPQKRNQILPLQSLADREILFINAKTENREIQIERDFMSIFLEKLDDIETLARLPEVDVEKLLKATQEAPLDEQKNQEEFMESIQKLSEQLQNQVFSLPENTTLDQLLKRVGKKVGVPFGVLKGVLTIEGPRYLSLSPEKVREYSQPGYLIPGCRPNVCSATGPMQMTIGYDNTGSRLCGNCCWQGSCLDTRGGCPNQWAIYGSAVQQYEDSSRIPNACNLLDNLYAAAAKLKRDSRTGSKNTNWSKDEVYRASLRYYGNCTVKYKRLKNKTYCEFVYYIYKQLGD